MTRRSRSCVTRAARGWLTWALAPALVVGIVVGGGGCSAPSRRRLTPQARRNVAVSEEQLRVRVRSLLDPLCGRLERQADAVIAGATDRGVRLAALSWEVEAVPALRQALYQPDPITAAVDALALCHQMADYFETGPGRQALGPASADCAATCRGMADDVLEAMTAATKSGDVPKLRGFAKQWAADHPIRGSIAERKSSVARMSDFLSAEGISTGERVAEVSTTLDDMNRKFEVYSDQLVRQARWEAQRLKAELVAELRLDQAIPLAERAVSSADQAVKSADQAVRTIDRLSPAVDRSLKVAEEAPALIAKQREMALAGFRDEVTRAMHFARDERLAVTADLKAGIVEQRKQVATEAGEIAAKQIDYAMRGVTWLVALVMSVALVVALLGVVLV